MERKDISDNLKKVEIRPNGPYIVSGDVPLVSKTQVVSEYCEPMTWKKEGEVPAEEPYFLCRCGQSSNKPFCDGTHRKINFDGTEMAPTDRRDERQETYPGCQNIVIRIDMNLCMGAGFCGNHLTSIADMATHTDDTLVRAQAIAMIEHCPSGALTFTLKEGDADIEADLPQQIAVTTEITSQGPIQGPLWVTGGITIIRSDGQPFETRNKVTLCNCGHSQIKPLCDGSHREYPTRK
jgi:CDGSH-type Zn-finger protein/ferredoxin